MEPWVALLERDGSSTGLDGEEWRKIAYPGFRDTGCVKAWKYVSDGGKLMTGDFRVLQARPGKGYCQTSLSVCVDGAYAGTARVHLHRIVAHTFLGMPPCPFDTVDHINRVREDNRACNLRWASPRVQMSNREFPRYSIKTSLGSVHDSMASLSRETGISVGVLSSLLRHAECGDAFEIKGLSLVLESVSRKRMACPVAVTSLRKVAPARKRRDEALSLFLEGLTVEEVGARMHIAPSTVSSYIGQAARESQRCTLQRLALRVGLSCPDARQCLGEGILAFHRAKPAKEDYDRKYRDMVMCHLPQLGSDWHIVREIFQSLANMLKEEFV
jgi:hypothetical protein